LKVSQPDETSKERELLSSNGAVLACPC